MFCVHIDFCLFYSFQLACTQCFSLWFNALLFYFINDVLFFLGHCFILSVKHHFHPTITRSPTHTHTLTAAQPELARFVWCGGAKVHTQFSRTIACCCCCYCFCWVRVRKSDNKRLWLASSRSSRSQNQDIIQHSLATLTAAWLLMTMGLVWTDALWLDGQFSSSGWE